MIETINTFIKRESSAGIHLVFVTIIALVLKNSGLSEIYSSFLHTYVEVRFGGLQIAKLSCAEDV